ncbi:hypothetical protein BDZ91DRAFT_711918, partial [Kalaharituber pfeilii]
MSNRIQDLHKRFSRFAQLLAKTQLCVRLAKSVERNQHMLTIEGSRCEVSGNERHSAVVFFQLCSTPLVACMLYTPTMLAI